MTDEEARQFDNVRRHLEAEKGRRLGMEAEMWVSDRMVLFMWEMGCTGIGARGDREVLKAIVDQANLRAHSAVGRLVTAAQAFAFAATDEASAELRAAALALAATDADGVLAMSPRESGGRQ